MRRAGFIAACGAAIALAAAGTLIDLLVRPWRSKPVDWSDPALDDPLASWHYRTHPSYPCDPLLAATDDGWPREP